MSGENSVNSNDYWDRRFREDWGTKGGPSQSRFFARLMVENLPAWLFQEIRRQSWSVVDWGCAQGDGTDVLASVIDGGRLTGIDFSSIAIEQAKDRYPALNFKYEDWLSGTAVAEAHYDVVLSSNTLEHFHQPFEVLEKVCAHARKAVVIIVPFREIERIDEHFFTFLPSNVPLEVANGFRLVWSRVRDCGMVANPMWGGDQLFLVYLRPEALGSMKLMLGDSSIEQTDIAAEHTRAIEELNRTADAQKATLRSEFAEAQMHYEAERARLEAVNAQLEARIAAQHAQYVAVDWQRGQWEMRARALESSTSWRVTAPLRASTNAARMLLDFSKTGARVRQLTYLYRHGGAWSTLKWTWQRLTEGRQPASAYAWRDSKTPRKARVVRSPRRQKDKHELPRVAFYVGSLCVLGGLELWVQQTAQQFLELGFEPVLIVYDELPKEPNLKKYLAAFPGDAIFLDGQPALLANYARELKLRAVLVNHVYEGVATLDRDVSVIEVLHNIYFWQGHDEAIAAARQRIDQFVAVSSAAMSYAQQYLHIDPRKLSLQLHALSARGLYRPYRSYLEKRRQSKPFTVLCVANIYHQKNLICLVEAYKRMNKDDSRLLIVGEKASSDLVARLKVAIDDAKLGDRVQLVGSVDRAKLSRFYSSSHMFVLPSLYEGYGMAVLEAIYFGLPIVISNTGASSSFVNRSNPNGVVVDIAMPFEDLTTGKLAKISVDPAPKDIEALYKGMQRVVDDYDRYLTAALDNSQTLPNLDQAGVARSYLKLVGQTPGEVAAASV